MPKNKTFKLFQETQPVRGFLRSIIYDLGRGTYHFIPNEMLAFIQEIDNKGASPKKYPIEYLEFLLNNEIIFEVEAKEIAMFPKLELIYDEPNLIH